jgi:hypothetical protein
MNFPQLLIKDRGDLKRFLGDLLEYIEEFEEYSVSRYDYQNLLADNRDLEAQEVIQKTGALRHPQFVRFRDDKKPSECVWDAHIRK